MKFLKTKNSLINIANLEALMCTPRYATLDGKVELLHWSVEFVTLGYSGDLETFDTEAEARKYLDELTTKLGVEIVS